MTTAKVNGLSVLSGVVSLPAGGAWWADLVVDDETALPTTARAVTLDLGGQTLVGTVIPGRQGAYAGTGRVRLTGGAGGMDAVLPARKYRGVPTRIPVLDVLTEAGELLSATSDALLLAAVLTSWTRARAAARASLHELLKASGAAWRVLPDGSIWFGVNAWPVATFEGDILEERFGGSWRRLSPDTGQLLPGTTLQGQRLGAVVYRFGQGETRAEAWAA